ncbi:MAG: bifunctional methylenetetrahydrofolate dehydrogenase/methenyltetrahydrofolate cyclohydrolase FolD [Anaerolineales bacterium]|nr:bifunctional methylenetetrahydrofolate dehydrogenase/methenyltetrahydrofolate cyclohydrolase FolD [Anaerolineales bacterium]
MTANILDGKAIAASLRAEIATQVAARGAAGAAPPGLATVLVGDDPASAVYVRNKHKACAEVGMHSIGIQLPAATSQAELLAVVAELNARADVHGILVQLPLPAHIDALAVISAIDVHKDVDCLHPENVGLLAQKGRQPRFAPCTPAGVMHILQVANIPLAGANAVVLGRSNIVGMPLSLLLVRADATVTIAHSRTRDLPAVCRAADVLVAAVGVPEMVRADWVKPGATVIDVGINRIADPAAKSGSRLVGDVAYAEVAERAGAITPVPGGVGPMTIAMLLSNTLRAAEAETKEPR